MRFVTATDGIRLAVYEHGDPNLPTLVCVHGYPDDHTVWDGIVAELSNRYHVVTYDVRGMGASGEPARLDDYRIARLNDDLSAVINAVSPDRPVHLLAHDWGSMQCWNALTSERLGERIASFTSISGPSIDHIAIWLRRHPIAAIRQLCKSYYIFMVIVPGLLETAVRVGAVDLVVKASAWFGDKTTPATVWQKPGRRESLNGIKLYRANFIGRLRRPAPPASDVPTLVIAPTSDMHVLVRLQHEAPEPHCSNLRYEIVPGNHWLPVRQPALVARLVDEHIQNVGS